MVTPGTLTMFLTLLSLEYGEMRVARLSRDKFIVRNIHGYVEKKNETAYDI